MRSLLVLWCVLVLTVARAADLERIVSIVSAETTLWKSSASNSNELLHSRGFVPNEQARKALEGYNLTYSEEELARADIPVRYDVRDEHSSCVHPIRDQSVPHYCGSCWAMASSETFSDRLCMATNGSVNTVLSTEQLVDCNLEGLEGCSGGDPVTAFLYASVAGLVDDACYPYTAGPERKVGSCQHKCSGEATEWVPHKARVSSIRWHVTEKGIQLDILKHGPVAACFTIYEDFHTYKSGIYHHVTGKKVTGHCVKIIGWDVSDEAVPYWIIANSHGTKWGMNGFFWMKRGSNECGLEREAYSLLPRQ